MKLFLLPVWFALILSLGGGHASAQAIYGTFGNGNGSGQAITSGTTLVQGPCTSGYELYDNAGVLGCRQQGVTVGAPITGSCPTGDVLYSNGGVIGCKVAGGSVSCSNGDNLCALTEVNIVGFGAKCDNVTDDRDAIQAAIDYAFNNSRNGANTVYIPALDPCLVNLPIYFDAPGGLRGADATANVGYVWAVGDTFPINYTVLHGGVAYISLQANNIGHTPGSSPTWWRAYLYDSMVTYASGDIVSFNGIPWLSLQNSNTGHSPAIWMASGTNYWTPWWVPPAVSGNIFMGLVGSRGSNQQTSILQCGFSEAICLVVGTGNGMLLKNFGVYGGIPVVYRTMYNQYSIGIGISGGSSGAQNTKIEDVSVTDFGVCIKTGWNQDALGADNHFNNITAANCGTAFYITQTQNDINTIDHAVASYNNTDVYTNVGKDVLIKGGNWSPISGVGGAYTMAVTSLTEALCAETSNNTRCFSMTATIAAPDIYWGTAVYTTTYNSFNVLTADFGPVPFKMFSWNPATGVATFQSLPVWNGFHFGNRNSILTDTNLGVELNAATTIYAAERLFEFVGSGFDAIAPYIEASGGSCHTMVTKQTSFNAGNRVVIDHAVENSDPSLPSWGPKNTSNPFFLAQYYCAKEFPYVDDTWDFNGGSLTISHYRMTESGSEPFNIDSWTSGPAREMYIDVDLYNPNMRSFYPGASGNVGNLFGNQYNNGIVTWGEFDRSPWRPINAAVNQTAAYTFGPLAVPFAGMMPNPAYHPRLLPDTYTTITTMLGALGTYPLIYGGTIYSTLDTYNSGLSGGKLFAVATAFKGGSYGQDLDNTTMGSSIAWSYLGQSFKLNVDATTMIWMVPGLYITLYDGSTTTGYVVVGTQPGLDYIEIVRDVSNLMALTIGTQTVTYNCPGSCNGGAGQPKIGQQAFSFTQF